jgi:peroxiredoxin
MKKKLQILLLAVTCWMALGYFAAISAEVAIGKQAPDFKLTDTNGKEQSLSDYRGNYIVLEWTNPDCPFVHKHYDTGNMQNLQKAYTEKGVVWFSIDSSAPGKQGNYPPAMLNGIMAKRGAKPTAFLVDSDGALGRLYGAKTTPHMFVVDPEGKLIYDGAIDDKPSTNHDDIASAKNYVQLALDEAMSGKDVSTTSTPSYGCSIKY